MVVERIDNNKVVISVINQSDNSNLQKLIDYAYYLDNSTSIKLNNKYIKLSSNENREDLVNFEKQRYLENKENYIKHYEGKYIALMNGEVIEVDTQFSNIVKKVIDKYNDKPYYITLVNKDERKYKLRKPLLKSNKGL